MPKHKTEDYKLSDVFVDFHISVKFCLKLH